MPKIDIKPKRFAEILDAAAEIFAEKGYHGASTTDIADKLGIKQAGLYYYFKSKDSALAEVCRLGVQGYVERLVTISQSELSADQKIRAAIREHLQPFHHIRNHVRVFQSERRYLAGENRSEVNKLARKYERELRRLFEAGVAAGEFRQNLDCKLTTLALLGMCNSVTIWYDGKSEKQILKIADNYADIIIGGVVK
jgi:AcrR family transcriptional regulator|tara:strand:- start:1835 stop:2422 length:588 start_codon:yes stop_codon:yes gene_type:complete